MAENLIVAAGDKHEKYQTLVPQTLALIDGETDIIATLANVASALNMTFDWLWAGFYLVKGEQLVLGPFQGPIACTRIPFGKGVCGSAWQQNRTLVVEDVEAFPGHIACSSSARSEIVVPVHNGRGEVVAVLDVDSVNLADFDSVDAEHLERIVKALTPLFD